MDLDIRNDATAIWTFPIEPTANTVEGYRTEFPDILERFFGGLAPIYVPQHVSWTGFLYDADVALVDAVGQGASSSGSFRDTFDNPAGFTPEQLATEFEAVLSSQEDYPVIDIVDCTNGILSVIRNGMRSISSEDADEFVSNSVVVDPDAGTHNAMSVWMDCRASEMTGYEPQIITKLKTYSGLWFEETADSRRSRDRLREVLRSIAAEFDVEYVHTTTELYKLEECNLTGDDILG